MYHLQYLQNTYNVLNGALEVGGGEIHKNSRNNTLIDKGIIEEKRLSYQYKQDSIHNAVSPFLYRPKNLCLVDQRRGKVRDLLVPYLTQETTSVVEGVVLGGGEIEKSLKNLVRSAGVSHVLSASGSNVSLFLILNSQTLRKKFGSFFTTITTGFAVVGYLSIAGCTPPLVRATVTALFTLLGNSLWKRKLSQGWLLLVTGAGMVLISASYLTNISFQLSMAACTGILIAPKLFPDKSKEWLDDSIHILKQKRYQTSTSTANFPQVVSGVVDFVKVLREWVSATIKTTLAIQILTLPIVVLTFGELSILAVVSNVAIVWLVPFIIAVALATVLFSFFHISLIAAVAGQATELLTQLFLKVIHILGSWEFATLTITDNYKPLYILIYFFLVLTYFLSTLIKKKGSTFFERYFCH